MNASKLFLQHAIEKDNEKILTREKFINVISSIRPFGISQLEAGFLFNGVSSGKPEIKQDAFKSFIDILESGDAGYRVLGLLAGYSGVQATVPTEQVKAFLKGHSDFTTSDFNSESVKLLLNSSGSSLSYSLFVELLDVMRQERVFTFFRSNDIASTGFIPGDVALKFFASIPAFGNPKIHGSFLACFKSISFPELHALDSLFRKLSFLELFVKEASKSSSLLDKSALSKACATLPAGSLSPLELDIVIRLVGGASVSSFQQLFNPIADTKSKETVQLSAVMETAKSIYNFALGSIAGATGAFAVYPIGKIIVGQLI